MSQIHPTAVVEDGAVLQDGVVIGPMCTVGAHARLGSGTRLVSHVAVLGRTTLGKDNVVWPQTVLGGDPQDLKYRGEPTTLEIGDSNDIRECVTMNLGTENGGGLTRVGDNNLVMAYSHVGHDCIIGSHCILANSLQLAGHILIEDHANIGGATAIHHYVTVGQYSFVGGMTRVVHDVPPFMIVEGNPSRVRGVNIIGMRRHQVADENIDALKRAWRLLYKNTPGENGIVHTTAEAIDQVEQDFGDDEYVDTLLKAIRNASIGMHGRHRESSRSDNRYTNPVR